MIKYFQNKIDHIQSAFRPLIQKDDYDNFTKNIWTLNNKRNIEIIFQEIEDFTKNINENETKNFKTVTKIQDYDNDLDIKTRENSKIMPQKNIFCIYKRGRTKKENRNCEIKYRRHDKYSLYNSTRRILHSCNQCIYAFILKKLPKNQKINRPTIENQLGYKIREYHQFLKKTYHEIIKYSIPKRYKGQHLKEKNEKLSEEDKQNIYKLNEDELSKILNDKSNLEILLLLGLTFGDYLDAYINDKKYINKNDIEINLEEFKTFKDCFNKDNDIFPIDKKEKYKQYIINIINNENFID